MTDALGRFGHHPDPAIDFCVEVECLEGMAYDAKAGLQPVKPLRSRIENAMSFRVGGDAWAVGAKGTLRVIDGQVREIEATHD